MERLQSQQDNLRLWLSADAEHIITECEDILRVSEYKEITKQPSDEQKISSLLRTIINNGAETCESFTEILRKNQSHYHQLQQFFRSCSEGLTVPTVFADNNSIVTTTNFSNITGKCLKRNLETECNPRGNSSGNTVSGNDYTATGGSVICADRLDGVNVDNMDFSVTIRSSQVPSAPGRAADLPCQDPAGKTITEHKVRLTEYLMADANYILQHAHQKSIVTNREYQNLKAVTEPEKQVTQLIDQVISKGPEIALQFLQLLKEPEVLKTFPQLRNILDTGS